MTRLIWPSEFAASSPSRGHDPRDQGRPRRREERPDRGLDEGEGEDDRDRERALEEDQRQRRPRPAASPRRCRIRRRSSRSAYAPATSPIVTGGSAIRIAMTATTSVDPVGSRHERGRARGRSSRRRRRRSPGPTNRLRKSGIRRTSRDAQRSRTRRAQPSLRHRGRRHRVDGEHASRSRRRRAPRRRRTRRRSRTVARGAPPPAPGVRRITTRSMHHPPFGRRLVRELRRGHPDGGFDFVARVVERRADRRTGPGPPADRGRGENMAGSSWIEWAAIR